MAFSLSNTKSFADGVVKENGLKALQKAKKLEEERINNGWRWVKLSETKQILVPFGKNGKPTQQGKQMLDKAISLL